ncbi:MAG TPA: GatB/YqeY domain-containing protein [Longimicrobiales bacterium]|nr:GatB/YqeY domain-containing protein [Longimicrobiales bacterium]
MAQTLKERLRDDLNDARRSRDKLRTLVLTTTISDVRNKEIDVGHELSDDEVVGVLTTAIKRRREAAEQMRAGGRTELAEKEEAEATILAAYLPAGLSEDDVREMIREAIAGGASSIGAVMGQIAPRIKGRFEGREANRLAREALGG